MLMKMAKPFRATEQKNEIAKRKRKGFLVLDGMASVAIPALVAAAGLGFYLATQPGRDGESLANAVVGCVDEIDKTYGNGKKDSLTTRVAINTCIFDPDYLDTEDPQTATKVVSNGGETEVKWTNGKLNSAVKNNAQFVQVINLPSDQCQSFVEVFANSVQDVGVQAASGTSVNYENLKKNSDGSKPQLDPGSLSIQCNSSDYVNIGGRLI